MAVHPRALWRAAQSILLALFALPLAAHAGNLSAISASPNPANLNATVTAQVVATGSACGALIQWGDGSSTSRFIVNGTASKTHAYSQPGSYQVRAIGKPHNGKSACGANNSAGLTKQTTLVVQNASSNPGGIIKKIPAGVLNPKPKPKIDPEILKKVPTLGPKTTIKPGLAAGQNAAQWISIIDKVRIKPHGTWAEFEVLTKDPAAVVIEASTQPPNGNSFSNVTSAIFTLQYRISSKTSLQSLEPDKDYYYVVKARTKDDRVSYHKGQFSTSGRKVKVTFSKVHVTDDGDGGASGKGDFTFYVKAFGQQHITTSHDIASGDDWYPNRSFTLANVPAALPLSLGVVEEDGDFVSIGWYAKSFGLETHGPGENETWTRTLHAANGEYSLTATFKFEVSYE